MTCGTAKREKLIECDCAAVLECRPNPEPKHGAAVTETIEKQSMGAGRGGGVGRG